MIREDAYPFMHRNSTRRLHNCGRKGRICGKHKEWINNPRLSHRCGLVFGPSVDRPASAPGPVSPLGGSLSPRQRLAAGAARAALPPYAARAGQPSNLPPAPRCARKRPYCRRSHRGRYHTGRQPGDAAAARDRVASRAYPQGARGRHRRHLRPPGTTRGVRVSQVQTGRKLGANRARQRVPFRPGTERGRSGPETRPRRLRVL